MPAGMVRGLGGACAFCERAMPEADTLVGVVDRAARICPSCVREFGHGELEVAAVDVRQAHRAFIDWVRGEAPTRSQSEWDRVDGMIAKIESSRRQPVSASHRCSFCDRGTRDGTVYARSGVVCASCVVAAERVLDRLVSGGGVTVTLG